MPLEGAMEYILLLSPLPECHIQVLVCEPLKSCIMICICIYHCNYLFVSPAVSESVFVIKGKTALISEIAVSGLQKEDISQISWRKSFLVLDQILFEKNNLWLDVLDVVGGYNCCLERRAKI